MEEELFKCPKCGNEYLLAGIKGEEEERKDATKKYPGNKLKKVGNDLFLYELLPKSNIWTKGLPFYFSIIFACKCGYCSDYQDFSIKN